MRVVSQQSQKREVFAWLEIVNVDGKDAILYFLSPYAETTNGRRPVNRYDSEQELLQAANSKGCRVTWLTS